MKKICSIILVLCIITASFTTGFALESAVGSGSNNPFIISNKDEFLAFAQKANASKDGLEGQYYLLTANIDLEGINWNNYGIGSATVPFKGHFDGNGHTISNYEMSYYNPNEYYGLFDVIGGYATIKNLGVVNAKCTTSGAWIVAFGGLVGYMIDNAEITGCFSKNTSIVTTTSSVSCGGGLVGKIESDGAYISNCYSIGSQMDDADVDYDGGLVGGAVKVGGISKCFTDTYLVRVGDKYDGSLDNCYYVKEAPWPWSTGSWGSGIYPGTRVSEAELKAVPSGISDVFEKSSNGGYPCFAWEAYADTLGGLGSVDNPYLIKTVDDLKSINDFGDAKLLNFRLENDIDLGGEVWTHYIGNAETAFKGKFDGNGHIIKNYKIVLNDSPTGLFGVVGGSGAVTNLGVSDVVFEHDTFRAAAGGIVGELKDNAYVSGCYAKNMSATRPGGNSGTETLAVGGIVGKIDSDGAAMSNCYALDCDFSTGYVDHDGGLVGLVKAVASVSNCYTNTLTMRYSNSDGSLISNVFSKGAAHWPFAWDGSNTGYPGTILSDNDLKTCHTRLGSAFMADPVEEPINNGYPVLSWECGETSLAFSGDGTELSPYIISSVAHLNYIADMNTTQNKYFKLVADINFNGAQITRTIGTHAHPFKGVFDGNGHVIKNYKLVADVGTSYGLFGAVGGNGAIKNLGIEDVEAYSDIWIDQLGGLAGRITDYAVLDGCYAKNVTMTAATTDGLIRKGGALAGCISSAFSTVKNCYSIGFTATDAEVDYNGGLIGSMTEAATVANCYSDTNLLRCKTGLLTNITDCYYITSDSWFPSSEAYAGAKIKADLLKSEGVDRLGSAFTNDTSPVQSNGYPILKWEVKYYLLGNGTAADPYLIRSLDDLKLLAENTETEGVYYKLTDDIDLNGKKWVTIIGSDLAAFKGYIDGNGKVIKNFKLDVTDGSDYGIFGTVGGNAHIYNLGVENVTVNASSNGATVGGIAAKFVDNAKLTGCFAKNVTFVGSNDKVEYGGGLIGKINGSGVEIKSCYASGTSGLSAVKYDGGFAGAADTFAYFEDCYSDTTLLRCKDGLTADNSFATASSAETTSGYVWAGTVKNANELDYDWSNDFVPVLNKAPVLKWEKYRGSYVNMIANSAMDTNNPDSLFNTTGAEVVRYNWINRNSEVLKLPRTTTFKYDLDMSADECYRVSFLAKTQGGVEETPMEVYLGGINLSEQFVADKITNDWCKKVIYVKPEKSGINRLAIGAEAAIYLDNVEVELVNQAAELAEVNETLVHNQPLDNSPITSFEVMTDVCDGLEIRYSSTNDYIDKNGNVTSKVPVGDGTVETEFTATVYVADKSITKSVTLNVMMQSALRIDSVEFLVGDEQTDFDGSDRVENITVSIAPNKEVDLIVAVYNGDKLVGMKQITVETSGSYYFGLSTENATIAKVFMFEHGTLKPLLAANMF